jgi:hypothetical protein
VTIHDAPTEFPKERSAAEPRRHPHDALTRALAGHPDCGIRPPGGGRRARHASMGGTRTRLAPGNLKLEGSPSVNNPQIPTTPSGREAAGIFKPTDSERGLPAPSAASPYPWGGGAPA